MIKTKDLTRFYATKLGQYISQQMIKELDRQLHCKKHDHISTIGYAQPVLNHLIQTYPSKMIPALFPVAQGLEKWPPKPPHSSIAVEDSCWPIEDDSADHIICLHGLEHSANPNQFMRETRRILKPDGELYLYVPNRFSLWARSDKTPFGYGQPYSANQLRHLLSSSGFTTLQMANLINVPPSRRALSLTSNRFVETIGRNLWPAFSGLFMVHARKDLLRPIGEAQPSKDRLKKIKLNPVPSYDSARTQTDHSKKQP